MTTWIRPDDILEASRRDLTIIVGISPAAQSTRAVVVEHCRVLGVKGVYHVIFQNTGFVKGQQGHTKGPVPVWGRSCVPAFVPQRVFKMFDEIAMPWQEEPGEVNLK